MKHTSYLFRQKVLTIVTVTLGLPLTAYPGRAEMPIYYCGDVNGTPTTMMRSPRGDIPLVQWLTRSFSSVFTPEARCQHVTRQFNAAYNAGEKYLTIGKRNGYDIICSAREAGGECQRQLMTIPKGTDPIATLEMLKNIQNRKTSEVLIR